MYDHTFYKQVQISRSDIRPHIKWAVSLVILHMVTSISLQGLCGYIWVNILTLSPQRGLHGRVCVGTVAWQSTRRPLMILALTYWLSFFATYVSMMQSNILLLLCFKRRASCVVISITRTADFCCCNVCCSEVVVAAYPRFWDWVYHISSQLFDFGSSNSLGHRASNTRMCVVHFQLASETRAWMIQARSSNCLYVVRLAPCQNPK